MSEAGGFVADICEHPEDDAPRLVYADWLDDHGDAARAAFIRAQIELARLDPFDDRRPALVRRERALLVEHGAAWALDGAVLGKPEYGRGFVHRLTLDVGVFAARADALFAAHPLRELGGRDATNLDALTASPHLARLRRLELFRSREASEEVARLAASPHVRGLEALAVTDISLDASAVRSVLESPHLGALTTLRLNNIHPGAVAVAVEGLASGHAPRALTRLGLSANRLAPDAVRRLCHCDRLEYLDDLALAANKLPDEAIRDLVATGRLRALRSLDLSSNALTPAGVRALAGCPDLAGLRHLDLDANRRCLDAASAAALADAAALAGLRSLGLLHAETDSAAVVPALLRAPFVRGLRALTLCLAAPNSAAALFRTDVLAGAWSLRLVGAERESVAMLHEVASATYLTAVTHLSLESQGGYAFNSPAAVSAAVARLAAAPHLAGLVEFRLWRYPLGWADYRALVGSPYLPRWCRLDLRPRPPDAVYQALRERFAEVSVR